MAPPRWSALTNAFRFSSAAPAAQDARQQVAGVCRAADLIVDYGEFLSALKNQSRNLAYKFFVFLYAATDHPSGTYDVVLPEQGGDDLLATELGMAVNIRGFRKVEFVVWLFFVT